MRRLAAAMLLFSSGLAWAQTTSMPAGYRSDEVRVASTLREFQMTELLEALAARSNPATIEGQLLQAQLKIAQTHAAQDDAQRQARAGEAIAVLDGLIQRTANAATDSDRLRNFRLRLDRAILEGVTLADPCAERLQYFLGRPGDDKTLDRLTGNSLKILDDTLNAMRLQRESWAGNEDKMVTGVLWRLDEMISEARYRGSWIRFYRAMAMSDKVDGKPNLERSQLLAQTVGEVAEFTSAEDNASGVKYPALLLSGMAARENGEFEAARGFFAKVADPAAGITYQLKGLFETAHSLIDEGRFDQAQQFIDTEFVVKGGKLAGPANAIMVEMQGALLRSQLLEVRSNALQPTDPAAARKLMDEAIKVLLEFVDKHPNYRAAFMEVIAPKYEGRDPKDLSPDIQLLLAVRQFNANDPQARQEASKLFEAVRQNAAASPNAQANSLWYLALIEVADQHHREAARLFRELAQKFPTHAHAKDAALNAVKSYDAALLREKRSPAEMGLDFVKEYADTLKVLVDGWGATDADIRSRYGYELGMQYDTLKLPLKAMEAFNLVGSTSELYIPSRYRILSQRVELLQDDNDMDKTQRRRQAESLLVDLRAYRKRAREYSDQATPERAKEVRTMGARCQMLEAQLDKDILTDPEGAIRVAEDLPKQWSDVAGVDRISREFIIRVMLEQGQIDRAMSALQNVQGSDELLAQAILQISTRIDRLEGQGGPEAAKELARYCEAYCAFAQRLFDSAQKKNLPPEQMYPYRQALARAYELGGKAQAKQALALYQELDKQKPNEFLNLRGLARCYRLEGDASGAMEYYDRLLDGLPENSADWWRIQIERLQFVLESRPTDRSALSDVLLQIRVLRDLKADKASAYRQLDDIEKQAKTLLGGGSESRPTSSSRPGGG